MRQLLTHIQEKNQSSGDNLTHRAKVTLVRGDKDDSIAVLWIQSRIRSDRYGIILMDPDLDRYENGKQDPDRGPIHKHRTTVT